MSVFETDEMTEALADITNTPAKIKNEDTETIAREKGWVKNQDYNYEEYKATSQATAADDSTGSNWAHNAAKYEWKEEYGDLGPEIPELEQQLFRSEFINRQGLKFDK
jgi:ATP-dependent RNA helicase DDX3X